MTDRMTKLRWPERSWEEFSQFEMIEELEKRDAVIIEKVLITEQFQKLLGVWTNTEALSKVAVLMREEDLASVLLSKALGHLHSCPEHGSEDLYNEIAAAFGNDNTAA